MQNLLERARKANPDRPIPVFECPYAADKACLQTLCAHYNPDAEECIHVEAAQALVKMAKEIAYIESSLKKLTAGVVERE